MFLQEGDNLLWNIERTITKIYIPVLLDSCMGDKGTKDLLTKVGLKIAFKVKVYLAKEFSAVIAQWIHLRLPFCCPRFES